MDKTFPISGKKLAALRKAAGYSQETFAVAIGRTVRSVAKYEGEDVAQAYWSLLPKLAEALRLSQDEVQKRLAPDPRNAQRGDLIDAAADALEKYVREQQELGRSIADIKAELKRRLVSYMNEMLSNAPTPDILDVIDISNPPPPPQTPQPPIARRHQPQQQHEPSKAKGKGRK